MVCLGSRTEFNGNMWITHVDNRCPTNWEICQTCWEGKGERTNTVKKDVGILRLTKKDWMGKLSQTVMEKNINSYTFICLFFLWHFYVFFSTGFDFLQCCFCTSQKSAVIKSNIFMLLHEDVCRYNGNCEMRGQKNIIINPIFPSALRRVLH